MNHKFIICPKLHIQGMPACSRREGGGPVGVGGGGRSARGSAGEGTRRRQAGRWFPVASGWRGAWSVRTLTVTINAGLVQASVEGGCGRWNIRRNGDQARRRDGRQGQGQKFHLPQDDPCQKSRPAGYIQMTARLDFLVFLCALRPGPWNCRANWRVMPLLFSQIDRAVHMFPVETGLHLMRDADRDRGTGTIAVIPGRWVCQGSSRDHRAIPGRGNFPAGGRSLTY